jgi:tetratricopeptide (TPR) repeat protein
MPQWKRSVGMRQAFCIVLVAWAIGAFQKFVRADDTANAADPIRARLDSAKAINAAARKQAADALKAACDTAIAANRDQPNLESQIKAQEDAFISGGAVPSLPTLQSAINDYHAAIDLADSNLQRAFARAIRHYSAENQGRMAMAVEKEKLSLAQQMKGTAAAPPAEKVVTPAEVDQALAQAKAQYRTRVNDARQALLAKVDARLNEVLDAGNLPASQALQAAEDALKSSGMVPDGSTDPVVIGATANYRHAIQTANVGMAGAYSQAVRDFTRARELDRAEAVQNEFITSELSGIDLNSVSYDGGENPSDTTYMLGKRLPDFLTTSDRWEPRGHGIFLSRHAFIRSKAGDYLDRDFACDVWFTIESTGTSIFIGIGEGRGRPADGVPLNSLALAINSPDNFDGAVGFVRADGQIDTIGHLSAGDYVARIRKTGNILTLSVGDEDADGTFNPIVSTTVTQTSVLAPFLTTHNAHLFFGGGRFWKVRYILGAPPVVVPSTVVKSLAGN